MNHCRLCHNENGLSRVKGQDKRDYWLCPECQIILVDQKHLLNREQEKVRYSAHQNSINDKGYVDFLYQVITPALRFVPKGAKCLDYGCGPGPTLSALLAKEGFVCDDYDPFFRDVGLAPPYDAVFSTETFEHFHHPAEDIAKITGLLRKDGHLVVMTEMWKTLEYFRSWHYTNDKTHVAFYHRSTFDYIAREFGFNIMHTDGERVVIMQKR